MLECGTNAGPLSEALLLRHRVTLVFSGAIVSGSLATNAYVDTDLNRVQWLAALYGWPFAQRVPFAIGYCHKGTRAGVSIVAVGAVGCCHKLLMADPGCFRGGVHFPVWIPAMGSGVGSVVGSVRRWS